MSDIDTYLENISPAQKAHFDRIRQIVRETVPDSDVQEMMSYGIPAFKYRSRSLLYFGAFKDHMSIFPASDAMIKEVGEELGKFRSSKGTLKFTEDHPISDTLVKKIVLHRLADITKS